MRHQPLPGPPLPRREFLSVRLRRADFPGFFAFSASLRRALRSRTARSPSSSWTTRNRRFWQVRSGRGKNPPFLDVCLSQAHGFCQVMVSACDAFALPPLLSRAEPLTMASTIGKIASRNAAAMSAAFVRFTCVRTGRLRSAAWFRSNPAVRRASRCREPAADPQDSGLHHKVDDPLGCQ